MPLTGDWIPSFCCVETLSAYRDPPSFRKTRNFNKDRRATSRVISCRDIVERGLELVTVNLSGGRTVIKGTRERSNLEKACRWIDESYRLSAHVDAGVVDH